MLSQLAPGDAVGLIIISLIAQGKVQSTLSYISCEDKGSVLDLDDIISESHGFATCDVIKDMHPPGKQACPESLLPDSLETVNPIIYSNLDARCISTQPCAPRVLPASLVLMRMHRGDCALR